MAEGTFPDVLKVGRVTPIFKKGNLEEVGNYRPVSTLPVFGKIFEKVMYSRIYEFALSQGIIDKNQFGFRKSHSTGHAVNYSVKIIEDSLRRKNHVLGIFIDLSKAFDTIDHSTLLVKLDRYGIRGNANSLIKNYLSDRTQYTDVLGEKSNPLVKHKFFSKTQIYYLSPQSTHIKNVNYLITNARVASNQNIECTR